MSTIGPGEIGGWFGSGGWYRATGESVTSPDGSIAWKYVNPYTWFDGCDRNEGNEVVMWAIELRTPLTIATAPRGLYLVQQSSSDQPTFPIVPTPPKDPPITIIPDPTGPGGGRRYTSGSRAELCSADRDDVGFARGRLSKACQSMSKLQPGRRPRVPSAAMTANVNLLICWGVFLIFAGLMNCNRL